MKKLFIAFSLFFFIILSSFKENNRDRKLQNGHYFVELDKEYKELGLNNYEFTLEDQKFIHKVKDRIENLEIVWIDDSSFKVKGLTEPLNPTDLEKEIIKTNTIYFRITKQEDKNYYFVLGEEFDEYPVYSGKFVKIK